MLQASHMYGLDRKTKYCCGFLQSVSSDNSLAIQIMATKLSIESVAEKASKLIAKHCSAASFLFQEKTRAAELLHKDQLVSTEDNVYKAVLAWMEAKDTDGQTCIQLFQHVH